jgi:hypothetical protein
MKHRANRKRESTLAELHADRPSAAAVYLALLDLSAERKSNVVTPTRELLAERTGVNVKSVSNALTALQRAGWIARAHVPIFAGTRQTATLLRITLCRRGRSTTHTGRSAVEGVKRPKGKGRSTPLDSPTERGGHPIPALSGTGIARESAPETQPTEHPSARIERERLAQIRARREARQIASADAGSEGR